MSARFPDGSGQSVPVRRFVLQLFIFFLLFPLCGISSLRSSNFYLLFFIYIFDTAFPIVASKLGIMLVRTFASAVNSIDAVTVTV